MDTYSQIVQPFATAVLLTLAVLLYRHMRRVLRTHLTSKQYELVRKVAETAVSAAEQLDDGNEGKKAYAMAAIACELARLGIALGEAELDLHIEAAVWNTLKRFQFEVGTINDNLHSP